jgi:pseudouridine-5'-phosphate glycosidase
VGLEWVIDVSAHLAHGIRMSSTVSHMPSSTVIVNPEVAEALEAGHPVVALESTIITHGLPRPHNLSVAQDVERVVRDMGAIPATIAIMEGAIRVGLTPNELDLLAGSPSARKASVRDLGSILVSGGLGSTTVAATAHIAHSVGIEVFATGGLGGVHREAAQTWDESADLHALARLPIIVVCSGIKSILDVPATLERLETLGVGVCGYRTNSVPGFYLRDTGFPVDLRIDDAAQVADLHRIRQGVKDPAALVVLQPVALENELSRAEHDAAVASAMSLAAEQDVTGKDVTPFLLDYFHRSTAGRSLRTNIALIKDNARLAACIANALSRSASERRSQGPQDARNHP